MSTQLQLEEKQREHEGMRMRMYKISPLVKISLDVMTPMRYEGYIEMPECLQKLYFDCLAIKLSNFIAVSIYAKKVVNMHVIEDLIREGCITWGRFKEMSEVEQRRLLQLSYALPGKVGVFYTLCQLFNGAMLEAYLATQKKYMDEPAYRRELFERYCKRDEYIFEYLGKHNEVSYEDKELLLCLPVLQFIPEGNVDLMLLLWDLVTLELPCRNRNYSVKSFMQLQLDEGFYELCILGKQYQRWLVKKKREAEGILWLTKLGDINVKRILDQYGSDVSHALKSEKTEFTLEACCKSPIEELKNFQFLWGWIAQEGFREAWARSVEFGIGSMREMTGVFRGSGKMGPLPGLPEWRMEVNEETKEEDFTRELGVIINGTRKRDRKVLKRQREYAHSLLEADARLAEHNVKWKNEDGSIIKENFMVAARDMCRPYWKKRRYEVKK